MAVQVVAVRLGCKIAIVGTKSYFLLMYIVTDIIDSLLTYSVVFTIVLFSCNRLYSAERWHLQSQEGGKRYPMIVSTQSSV